MGNNAKRKSNKQSISRKDIVPSLPATEEPRYAMLEETKKALKRVVELHGEAFRKLAE